MGAFEHDPLPHSHGATASHCDNDVDLLLLSQRPRRVDNLLRNVRLDLGELGHQAVAKRCPHARRVTGRLQAGGADKEDMLPERLRLSADAVDRPAPKEDAGRVECPAVTGRAGGPPSLPADRPRSPAIPHPDP